MVVIYTSGTTGKPKGIVHTHSMLRVHLMQNWFALSDPAMQEALIAALSSTKNADGERDPEMHQTKKGNQWRVSRTQAADLWCCTEDGSRPPEAGLQEKASNHPVLLRSKGVVVSDWAKVIP